MRYFLVIVLSLLAIPVVVFAHTSHANAARKHSCYAPCTVVFSPQATMHEDQFCIDYEGAGALYVWRDNDTNCK